MASLVRCLDRDRRTVVGAVTELRRHEAIVGSGGAGRWRVPYTGLRLVKAGPTGGAKMHKVEDHAAQLLERHLNAGTPATRWRIRVGTSTARAGTCRHATRTIEPSLGYVLRAS